MQYNITIMANFIGINNPKKPDWNFAMQVVDKIETIIEHHICIGQEIVIYWHYSTAKTGTFSKGFNGGGGETVKRTPFESIFGKPYQIDVYYHKEMQKKVKKNQYAPNKLLAVCLACTQFINWYNKNVQSL